MTYNQKSFWPIIIGGVHRSGTSLLRRILNSHSRIYCGPEVKFFKDWYGDYINDPIKHARFIESARAILPEEELLKILGQAFVHMHERAAQLANKPRWADKNPENVLYLSEWEQLLGKDWYFVHVARNPLDTLVSIADANFVHAIPSSLHARIELYKLYSEAGLTYYQANPERSYRIIYEKLVTSPQEEIERLMTWLGEKMELKPLDFNSFAHQTGLEDPKIRNTHNIHSNSINNWQTALTQEETRLILNVTLPLWKKLDSENFHPLG